MRFLCISDIHGHKDRLDAVLEHADLRGWDQLVVCGDLCFPGPDPLGVWKTLVEKKALCVQGLTDRALARLDPTRLTARTDEERDRIERLKRTHAELGELIIARLGKLQLVAHVPVEGDRTLTVVHGSPVDPSEPLTFEMTDDELEVMVGTQSGNIIVCGGSHVPFDRELEEFRVVNVGSVGEAATPGYAHATILETTTIGMNVTQYDVEL